MKTKLFTLLLFTPLLFTAVSTTTQAALVSRAGGTMIYDDVLDVTWLQDANYAQTSNFDADGLMHWEAAVTWADDLSFGGHEDWRLPGFTDATTCFDFNCTNSEYGHMFYNNLGATAGNGILTGSNADNLASFTNIQEFEYWSGVLFEPNPALGWVFDNRNGKQHTGEGTEVSLYAWAVRSGDVAAVPVPAAFWLFGSGLIGLVVKLNRDVQSISR